MSNNAENSQRLVLFLVFVSKINMEILAPSFSFRKDGTKDGVKRDVLNLVWFGK